MNPDPIQQTEHRLALKSRMVTKIHRYSALILRKWWVPVLCAGLGVALQAALYFSSPPTFISLGRMIVNIKLSLPEGSVYTEELSNFLGTQQALMQSGVVISRAHERAQAQMPGAGIQEMKLRVNVMPKTTIFVLQATGGDPRYTQLFLQGCMEEYINLKREMRSQTSETTLAGLTEEVSRLQKELALADEALTQFQSTNSVVLLQEQGNSAAAYLAALNTRLAALRSEYELVKALTLDQNLERQHAGGTLPLASDPTTRASQTVVETDYLRAKQQLLMLKAEMEDQAQYLKPRHPKMIAMNEEISRREKLLEIYRQQGAEQQDNRKASLALQIETLEREVREWDAKTLEITRVTAEYQKYKSNAQRIQQVYDRMLGTMQTLDVNKEISPESVTMMEKATAAFPEKPDLGKALGFGALGGLALALVVLLMFDRMDDRMVSLTELQDAFDEPVLGQIPRERPPGKHARLELIQAEDERFGLVEAYRNLRSSILYMAESGKRPKVIAITGSVPAEGKSFTAANLAICMANAGSRVLLIDADLRKGVLHDRFRLPGASPGFSESLAGRISWEEAVQLTGIANLSILPRGAATQNSSELFVRELTAQVLRGAAAKFDYVLLDNAPVMAADDVASLTPNIDGVLFLIRAEHTSARVARASLEMLYQRKTKVLGLIFNAVRTSSADYHYYKYEDYYRACPADVAKR
jgi:capsular exopolysaccharide synthesis family protein